MHGLYTSVCTYLYTRLANTCPSGTGVQYCSICEPVGHRYCINSGGRVITRACGTSDPSYRPVVSNYRVRVTQESGPARTKILQYGMSLLYTSVLRRLSDLLNYFNKGEACVGGGWGVTASRVGVCGRLGIRTRFSSKKCLVGVNLTGSI